MVFIIESFNKTSEEGSLYIVFFDIATKKVLLFDKAIGKPSGIGFRNYWAGAIANVLKKTKKRSYDDWEEKHQ